MTEIDRWYQEMMKQYEEDSKTHDFSIPEEWDWDFRCAMGIVELDECLAHAEQIQDSELSVDEKAKKLAQIMTAMERRFDIPTLRNLDWESKHKEIIEAYRRISDMREF